MFKDCVPESDLLGVQSCRTILKILQSDFIQCRSMQQSSFYQILLELGREPTGPVLGV